MAQNAHIWRHFKSTQIKKLMILNAIKLDIQHKMSPDMYILGQIMLNFYFFLIYLRKMGHFCLVKLSEHLSNWFDQDEHWFFKTSCVNHWGQSQKFSRFFISMFSIKKINMQWSTQLSTHNILITDVYKVNAMFA